MTAKSMVRAALLMAAAVMLSGQTRNNWHSEVVETEFGHRVGNPDAKVKLVEFFSYTCPHCAEFNREAEGALQLAYIGTGKVNVEIRHLIRDPVDLTVTVLANCGPPAKFPQNHTAFLSGQAGWIGPMTSASNAQKQRWVAPGSAGRRAIASDFGFYRIMERRGYTRAEMDRCLADETLVRRLAEQSDKDWDKPGIDATPSFAINGVVMPGTHSWAALSRQLDDFIRQTS